MGRQYIVDDIILWLSLLSIAVICLIMFCDGVINLLHVTAAAITTPKQAFAVSVYILFIVMPLMILNLGLDAVFINEILEWSLSVTYIIIIADILLMTVLYLATLI